MLLLRMLLHAPVLLLRACWLTFRITLQPAQPVPPDQILERHQRLQELATEANECDCTAERLRLICAEAESLTGYASVITMPVRSAVAAHPNAPPDLLAQLLPDCAEAFCRNPVASLIALEADIFLNNASSHGLECLLALPQAPVSLITLLASGAYPDPQVTEAARMHIALAGELLPPDSWADHIRTYWREQLAGAEELAREEVAEMVELGFAPASLFGEGIPSFPVSASPSLSLLALLAYNRVALPRLEASLRSGSFLTATPVSYWQNQALKYWMKGSLAGGLWPCIARHKWIQRALLQALLNSDNPLLHRIALRHPHLTKRMTARHCTRLQQRAQLNLVSVILQNRPQGRGLSGAFWNTPNLLLSTVLFYVYNAARKSRYDSHLNLGSRQGWQCRLLAALCLSPSSHAWPVSLSQDANRLVRAAAQARLRGEEFTWEDRTA